MDPYWLPIDNTDCSALLLEKRREKKRSCHAGRRGRKALFAIAVHLGVEMKFNAPYGCMNLDEL